MKAKIVAPDVPQWLLDWLNMPDYNRIPPDVEADIKAKLESGNTLQIMGALAYIFRLPMKSQDEINFYKQAAK